MQEKELIERRLRQTIMLMVTIARQQGVRLAPSDAAEHGNLAERGELAVHATKVAYYVSRIDNACAKGHAAMAVDLVSEYRKITNIGEPEYLRAQDEWEGFYASHSHKLAA
jgi:hypothetical protein